MQFTHSLYAVFALSFYPQNLAEAPCRAQRLPEAIIKGFRLITSSSRTTSVVMSSIECVCGLRQNYQIGSRMYTGITRLEASGMKASGNHSRLLL